MADHSHRCEEDDCEDEADADADALRGLQLLPRYWYNGTASRRNSVAAAVIVAAALVLHSYHRAHACEGRNEPCELDVVLQDARGGRFQIFLSRVVTSG